jgi:hypothetical protein
MMAAASMMVPMKRRAATRWSMRSRGPGRRKARMRAVATAQEISSSARVYQPTYWLETSRVISTTWMPATKAATTRRATIRPATAMLAKIGQPRLPAPGLAMGQRKTPWSAVNTRVRPSPEPARMREGSLLSARNQVRGVKRRYAVMPWSSQKTATARHLSRSQNGTVRTEGLPDPMYIVP